ncbi:unnamed protein product [Allacma fusca]|uniref:Glycosyl hydrolase family 13 catalytic domain-containing protein n=1 Tax=Allacma fusca TaxID=39272 RepID=A0A8J2K489_9HEXA|nr:unnamed protein product [Allacma fusca]
MKVVLVVLFSVTLIHYGYSNTVDKNAGPYTNDTKPLEWWQRTVLYQLYPRSFQDSDGDGIGDLNGITSKLDHFVDIGVEAIWICPIYQSPMVDFGYDISNFTNIEPDFGTLEDFRRMADEFHKRDLKLIMDQVPNHSSDQHEWFKKSIQGEEPYRDYYVWKNASGTDPDGKPLPPNNWVSVFGVRRQSPRHDQGEWATFLIGSHDQKRAATRWTEASIDGANMINLLLRGTAVTYYGEEIEIQLVLLCNGITKQMLASPPETKRGCLYEYKALSNDRVLGFTRIPLSGSNSIGRGALIGQTIDTRGVLLGARDAIVIEFTPTA